MQAHTTGWSCEACGAEGTLLHPEDADVYMMVARIHNAHRAASPTCRAGLELVRVWPESAAASSP